MPEFQLTTPVAFIIFNRPDTTERVFAEIAKAKPPKLLVVGDGPVEIREAVRRDALALGVASDEVARAGWNDAKVARLTRAGAHFLVEDLDPADELIGFLLS